MNPAANIKKPDIIGELQEHEVEFKMDSLKDELEAKYENVMTGIHHLPGILYESRKTNLNEVGLDDYEILPVEPLHTIAGHIKNIYQAMPSNLTKQEKQELEDAIDASFSGKNGSFTFFYTPDIILVPLINITKSWKIHLQDRDSSISNYL